MDCVQALARTPNRRLTLLARRGLAGYDRNQTAYLRSVEWLLWMYPGDVPVFMSSLLQVPFIQQIVGPDRQVGILCAQKQFLTDTHLQNVGIDLNSNFVIAGSQDEYGLPEFDKLWDHSRRPECPEAYYDNAEKDMVRISREFVGAHAGIGALMLECTGMQPFARAIQREIDLPVFSWGSLLDYAYSVVVHRDYYGHV